MVAFAHADIWRIKAATRDLIERAGGQERAGNCCGYSQTQMQRFASTAHPDVIPIPALLLLERDVGEAIGTALLAELQARAIGRAPPVAFEASYAAMNRRIADLQADIAESLRDHRLSPAERARIERTAAHVDRALEAFRQTIAKGEVS